MQDNNFRQHFPLLSEKVNGKPLIYFDNAATTQKPACVIQANANVYLSANANVHRAAHTIATVATSRYENSRGVIQSFIGATHSEEIVLTSGTTESINLVAESWAGQNLSPGDEILISYAEHHANIVPWQQICKKTGAKIKVVPLTQTGVIDLTALEHCLSKNTKLVALHHISNVVGKVNPIKQITALAKTVGATVLIDAAQSITHCDINVQEIGCDFLVFSMHKAFGPTGVGVLYGKKSILDSMPPYKTGGEMIKKVSLVKETTFNQLPFKFEPGTPNIAGVIATSTAIEFLKEHNDNVRSQASLVEYMYQSLKAIDRLNMIFEGCPDTGIFAFTIDGHHQQDIAAYMDAHGVALRVGHHCAMPLMEYLNIEGCVRASISAYNTREEVDTFVELLKAFLNEEPVLANNINSTDEAQTLIEQFTNCKGWDERHRQIMLISKKLTRMSSDLRNDVNLIDGCESKAWLAATVSDGHCFVFQADSDAKVIRGLLYLVLVAVNGKSAAHIQAFDFHQYFEELGLLQHLSPSRGNGLLAIVEKIKLLVANARC